MRERRNILEAPRCNRQGICGRWCDRIRATHVHKRNYGVTNAYEILLLVLLGTKWLTILEFNKLHFNAVKAVDATMKRWESGNARPILSNIARSEGIKYSRRLIRSFGTANSTLLLAYFEVTSTDVAAFSCSEVYYSYLCGPNSLIYCG